MRRNHPEIVLFEPEIPQNTGNIGRLAAATACRLHLVKPFGFSLSDKNLRRPGLDYWPCLDLEVHDSFEDLLAEHGGKIALFTKFADQCYSEVPEDTRLLVFGRETSGLPEEFHSKYASSLYKIPMYHPAVRSLNLSNAVSIVVYDQLRQRGLL